MVGLKYAESNIKYEDTKVYQYLKSKKSHFDADVVESHLLHDFREIGVTPAQKAKTKVIVGLLFNHSDWENCLRAYLSIVYGRIRTDGAKARTSAKQPCLPLSKYWFIPEIDETIRLNAGREHAVEQIKQVRNKIICLKTHYCDKTSKCGFLRAPALATSTEMIMSRKHFASATTSIKKITVTDTTEQRPAKGFLKRLQSFVFCSPSPEKKPLTALESLRRIDTSSTRKTITEKKMDHSRVTNENISGANSGKSTHVPVATRPTHELNDDLPLPKYTLMRADDDIPIENYPQLLVRVLV